MGLKGKLRKIEKAVGARAGRRDLHVLYVNDWRTDAPEMTDEDVRRYCQLHACDALTVRYVDDWSQGKEGGEHEGH